METDQLKQIGLSEKESQVYLELLQAGESIVSDISKHTKINRSLLYTLLSELSNKGMVTYIIKNNVRYYRAAEPSKILSLLHEKEKAFESILPKLEKLYSPRTKKPLIEILEGKEGIKTIFNDLLKIKKEWLAFNVPGKGPEIMGPMVHAFEKERQKEKIPLKVICTNNKEGRKRGADFSQMNFTQVRYTPEAYESPASNWLYGDRISLIFWYKEFPFVVRIIDQRLAESYRHHFKVLWDFSQKR